jgi:hypothetical protein
MHQWETKIGAIINETKRENVTSLAGVLVDARTAQ